MRPRPRPGTGLSPLRLVPALLVLALASPPPPVAAAPGSWRVQVQQTSSNGRLSSPSSLQCAVSPAKATVTWYRAGLPVPDPEATSSGYKIDNKKLSTDSVDGEEILISTLNITKSTINDHGNFTCKATLDDVTVQKDVFLNLSLPSRLIEKTKSPVAIGISKTTVLNCIFEGFNLTEVKWRKNKEYSRRFPKENLQTSKFNETVINGSLKLADIGRKDNGTYLCAVIDPFLGLYINSSIDLLVLDKPQISVDFIKAVGASKIYFNWTVNDGNAPVEEYGLQYRHNGSETWTYYYTSIGGGNQSYIVSDLKPSTSYQLRIDAKNSQGRSQPYSDARWTKTLETDPTFVPDIEAKGYTMSSVTIGWTPPPENISEFIHYYKLVAREVGRPEDADMPAVHSGDYRNLPYMFDKLSPATNYTFKVRACSELTNECGNWSQPVTASTMDGAAGPPSSPSLMCKYDNISGISFVFVTWKTPQKPNGKILRYTVELIGTATFTNGDGVVESMTWGPKIQSVHPTLFNAQFNSVPSNTNYTVRISAVTRPNKPGEPVSVKCSTPPSVPPRDSLQGLKWDKVREYDGRWMFRLHLPRVSERNGAICCYRVFLVRLRNDQKLSDMPSPEYLAVSTYKEVHNGKGSAGAYVAEMFTSKSLHTEVILGDGSTLNGNNENSVNQCTYCANITPRKKVFEFFTTSTTTERPLARIHNLNVETKSTVLPPIDKIPITQKPIKKVVTTTQTEKQTIVPITEKTEETIPPKPKKDLTNPIESKKDEEFKLSMEDLQNYQNSQPIKNSYSNFDDDKKYELDDDFYINRRIFHQNKIKTPTPYEGWSEASRIRNVYNSNMDIAEDEEDETDEFNNQILKTQQEDRSEYFEKHKMAKRSPNVVFEKLLESVIHNSQDHMDQSQRDILADDVSSSANQGKNERLKKLQEQRERDYLADKTPEVEKVVVVADKKPTESEEPVMSDSVSDGQLDIDSNYTGFVELLVHSSETGQITPVYSNYFSVLNPGPDDIPMDDGAHLEIILKVVIGCVGLALLLVLVVCVLHARGRKKARHHGVEMHNFQTTLRNLYRGIRGGRHQLVSPSPPDLPPINKEDLVLAFNERQSDSGYVFQQEFEMLPEHFPDRTTEGSDAKENQGKNRYPDIKAYDQSRVRLSHLDSIIGSDYINANFVMGYKERKKFICAQGPTDVTVDDFWRMIWEYNLDLVVMLTNLEEYSKVKCSKYWPDQNQQEKMFNNIKVQHVGEKRYSDYIIRELKISKPTISHSNSQIIELNGIKKNGDCSNGNGTASSVNDERIVKQYHFLIWKDFVAPEHPNAVLKFIKRVNEACGVGRTILVHCSAGVGRTGTLVALDCLIEQLNSEGHVSIFNTVYDLRRQRNFLVQSLKQYVFIYRSLLEYAQYGDSEIIASKLKSSVDRLKQTAENKDTCALEEEFEKLKQTLIEINKPCDAGKAPENIAKNRSESILPYDHNRVILGPIPTKPHSTYINASFIEGYENEESYIITQDPLPTTIGDFWRLVSEQEIPTIVMLSELGDGKCPRYWDDDEIQYDHISISYLQSTSCPYYTRREFQVTNTKNQERTRVTQLQYHGWPTVSGQVPEVTRGLIELIDQIGNNRPTTPPLLVHCNGTDRSSMFVALSILITQLRIERRIDVSSVTRKLRSQRMNCLDTFLQYEFLHRAIVNYAELHNLLNDS